jgi:hypothetical protein
LLKDRKDEQRQLAVKSVLFIAVWIPLALFVATSSDSILAKGFSMGVGLHLLIDIWLDWGDKNKLKAWLFWPIKRELTDQELIVVVSGFGMMFFLISLLLLV